MRLSACSCVKVFIGELPLQPLNYLSAGSHANQDQSRPPWPLGSSFDLGHLVVNTEPLCCNSNPARLTKISVAANLIPRRAPLRMFATDAETVIDSTALASVSFAVPRFAAKVWRKQWRNDSNSLFC